MSSFKFSKTGWLVLGASVFLVVVGGLGVIRSQQMQEQNRLDEDIYTVEERLDAFKLDDLNQQLEMLIEQAEDSESQLIEAQTRLDRTVASADVVEEFYAIAEFSGVTVQSLSNTAIANDDIADVTLAMTAINANVYGELDDIIDFIINLNNGFTAGYVKTCQISMPGEIVPGAGDAEPEEGEEEAEPVEDEFEGIPRAVIQLVVFSYEAVK